MHIDTHNTIGVVRASSSKQIGNEWRDPEFLYIVMQSGEFPKWDGI